MTIAEWLFALAWAIPLVRWAMTYRVSVRWFHNANGDLPLARSIVIVTVLNILTAIIFILGVVVYALVGWRWIPWAIVFFPALVSLVKSEIVSRLSAHALGRHEVQA